jgi:hypothetical protein
VGAANVLRVYHSWRRHLDDRPFCLLAYMALRARDNDAEPWYGAGHEELAVIALGLAIGTERERLAALRAVSRAMKALHAAGAIRTSKRARPGRQATYRLTLDGPTYDADRPVNNRADTPEHTTPTVVRGSGNVRRSADIRTTVSGASYDGERRTEEEEEEEERKKTEVNLRNGEMWKAYPTHLNGSAKPAIRADRPAP